MQNILSKQEIKKGNMIPYNLMHFPNCSNVTITSLYSWPLHWSLNILLKRIMRKILRLSPPFSVVLSGVWVQQGSQLFSLWWHRWQLQCYHQASETSDGKSTYSFFFLWLLLFSLLLSSSSFIFQYLSLAPPSVTFHLLGFLYCFSSSGLSHKTRWETGKAAYQLCPLTGGELCVCLC